MLKFFYNGIKENSGKLQKAMYSQSTDNNGKTFFNVYAREYTRFSEEIKKSFIVHNDTDTMTDYFDQDMIMVYSDHPLYNQVSEAFDKQQKHCQKIRNNR